MAHYQNQYDAGPVTYMDEYGNPVVVAVDTGGANKAAGYGATVSRHADEYGRPYAAEGTGGARGAGGYGPTETGGRVYGATGGMTHYQNDQYDAGRTYTDEYGNPVVGAGERGGVYKAGGYRATGNRHADEYGRPHAAAGTGGARGAGGYGPTETGGRVYGATRGMTHYQNDQYDAGRTYTDESGNPVVGAGETGGVYEAGGYGATGNRHADEYGRPHAAAGAGGARGAGGYGTTETGGVYGATGRYGGMTHYQNDQDDAGRTYTDEYGNTVVGSGERGGAYKAGGYGTTGNRHADEYGRLHATSGTGGAHGAGGYGPIETGGRVYVATGGMGVGHGHLRRSGSSSSEDDGYGGRRRRKKGLGEKIKDALLG